MDILQALAQQKQKVENGRVICDDGLLSISDAVFEVTLYKAGRDRIDLYLTEIPIIKRQQFLIQIGVYDE